MNKHYPDEMAEFVISTKPFCVPFETPKYRVWRWLWNTFSKGGDPPWPEKWCFRGVQVKYDTSSWPEERHWCEECFYFTDHKIMRRGGDIWTSCQICHTMMVE
jgi:hypothetical protein